MMPFASFLKFFETAKRKAEKVYVWGEIIQIVRIMYYSARDTGILGNPSFPNRR